MSSAQQTAIVTLAAAEGMALEGGLASPALVLAVKVCLLPTAVSESTSGTPMMHSDSLLEGVCYICRSHVLNDNDRHSA